MPASATHLAGRDPAGAASGRVALERWAIAALVAGLVAGVAWVASEPTPLGHDESVYALWARHWLEDTPATGVHAHRAPGVPAMLAVVQALGFDGEPELRAVGVAAGGVLVAATWALGRMMAGPVPGLVAAGVVASSPRVIDESARALTDVPAAALVVALIALLWWQLERAPGPSWWLAAAAPLAAAAFYVRYAAVLPLGLLIVAALALWWPRVRAHARVVLATAGLGVALLVPYLAQATLVHGSPIAPLLAGRADTDQPVGAAADGLVQLVIELSFATAGPVWAVALVVGTVLGAWRAVAAWRRGRLDRAGRAPVLLLVMGWGQLLITAAVQEPIPRYLLVAVALVAILAAIEGWAWLCHPRVSEAWRRGVIVVGAAVLATYAAAGVGYARLNRVEQTAQLKPLRAAASSLEGDQPCAVATGRVPQWTWYSKCAAVRHGHIDEHNEPRRYIALHAGSHREPDPDEAARIRDELGPPIVVEPRRTDTGNLGGVEVYGARRCWRSA